MKKWILRFASYRKPDDIFDLVLSGEKTIETRPRNPKSSRDYAKIQVGDVLILKSVVSVRIIEKKVSAVHLYGSVNEMVEKEDEEKIFPGIGSKENLVGFFEAVGKKWRSYAEKLDKYGIIAIGME